MTKANSPEQEQDNGDIFSLAQAGVDIPGLRPEIRGSDGRITRPSNLTDLAEQAKEVFITKPWYRLLLRDVRQGKKSAVFITVLGGITIFAATAAGFEFGIRHGQDLRNLPRILKRKK